MTLVSPLRSRRLELGLKQSEVGILVGVSGVMVSKWESAESFPRDDRLEKLAAALRRDPVELAEELREFNAAVAAALEARVTARSAVVAA
jgi:transcriptional regulator with XRE-family HTH domain